MEMRTAGGGADPIEALGVDARSTFTVRTDKHLLGALAAILMILVSTTTSAVADSHGSAASAAGDKNTLVLTNVNLLPMDQPLMLARKVLIIEDGKLVAVKRVDEFTPEEGARVIDGGGHYVLPSLADMHARIEEPGGTEEAVAGRLRLFLGHGITTVREMSGAPEILELRDAIASGQLTGPRIVAASPPLPARYAASPEKAREGVRELAARGYDLIQIERLERDVFLAVIEEAARAGIPVAGPVPDPTMSLEEVLESGLASLEGFARLAWSNCPGECEENEITGLAKRIAASEITLTALLGPDVLEAQILEQGDEFFESDEAERIVAELGQDGLDDARRLLQESKDWSEEELREHQLDMLFVAKLFTRLDRRKANIIAGTGSFSAHVPPGLALLSGLELLTDQRVDPYLALRMVTTNPSRLMGTLGNSGSLGIGKVADLILVKEHPGFDIETLREPVGLLLRGEWYDAAQLEAMRRGSN